MIRTILVQYCEKGITQLNSIEWYYLSFLCVLHVSAVKFTIFLSLRFDFFVPVISMKNRDPEVFRDIPKQLNYYIPPPEKLTTKKEQMNMITIDDFMKLKLVVATIKEVEDHPKADRLYLLTVDLGDEERTLVAGIKEYYRPEELIGKQLVMVENLEPATIRGVESRGMILAAKDGENLAIVTMDRYIAPGSSVS